jgi:hypothetical protein
MAGGLKARSSYRAGTLATLLALGAGAAVLERGSGGRLAFSTARHPGVVWLAVAAAAASLIASAEGLRLGHWQTDQSIAHELGGRIENERCEVIYPRSLSDDDARLLLRDCSTQARQVSAYLATFAVATETVHGWTVQASCRQSTK